MKNNLREYGLLMALVVIMGFFQVMTNGTLFQPLNLTNLILQNSYIVVMALGMLLVIVAGHIDLSVGSVSGFVGAVAAVLMVEYNLNFLLTAIICLVLGGAIGAAQGYWVAFYKIPAFIVTLAGMLVFRGLSLVVLGGSSVGPFPPEFQLLSTGFIPDPFGGENLKILSLVLGLAMALILMFTKVKGRAARTKHGMENEPYVLFWVKNLVFAAMIAAFSYL
ncbi:MAG TPA: sugar ABC transporter permease, partial [Rhodoferax sp.]